MCSVTLSYVPDRSKVIYSVGGQLLVVAGRNFGIQIAVSFAEAHVFFSVYVSHVGSSDRWTCLETLAGKNTPPAVPPYQEEKGMLRFLFDKAV